jgi:hypothetical protein
MLTDAASVRFLQVCVWRRSTARLRMRAWRRPAQMEVCAGVTLLFLFQLLFCWCFTVVYCSSRRSSSGMKDRQHQSSCSSWQYEAAHVIHM